MGNTPTLNQLNKEFVAAGDEADDKRVKIVRDLWRSHEIDGVKQRFVANAQEELQIKKSWAYVWAKVAEASTESEGRAILAQERKNIAARVKKHANKIPLANGKIRQRKKVLSPKLDKARDIVRPLVADDKPISRDNLVKEYPDISHVTFEAATLIERALKEEPNIDATTLSISAREQLAIAIRQHKRKLDAEFEARVREECRRRIEETILPAYRKEMSEAAAVIKARKGIMPRATFKKILACLHPDRVSGDLKTRYDDAFATFSGLEIALCSEKELPTQLTDMPRTYEDLMKRRQATSASRKSQKGQVATRH